MKKSKISFGLGGRGKTGQMQMLVFKRIKREKRRPAKESNFEADIGKALTKKKK